jgi:hypothetical protein
MYPSFSISKSLEVKENSSNKRMTPRSRRRPKMCVLLTCLATGGGSRNEGGREWRIWTERWEWVEIEEGARLEVTELFPPPFRFSPLRARACAISLGLSSSAFVHVKMAFLHQQTAKREWLARNGRIYRFSRTRIRGAFRTHSTQHKGLPSNQTT